MDPSLRRVYVSVGGILLILWIGMSAWVVKAMKPDFLSCVTAPSPKTSLTLKDFTPMLQIPGIRFSVYQTVSGDTFLSMARKFRLQEETLRSLNQANDSSQPKADTLITIPSKDGIFHMVRPGQGLTDIARAYEIPLKQVLSANHKMSDSDLRLGEILYLPGAHYLSRKDLRWLALASLEVKNGFIKPTTGRFADAYGRRVHPISGKVIFHEGVDLAPGWGARVVASQSGQVRFANIRAGYGRTIILDHGNGIATWYAHLDKILVKPQQRVKQGQLIGRVGNTGKVTGPHLHFEVRLKGKPQNPLLYLVQ
jgi:murein DD-endopeptidase MepM/ murein hydrolase activator NlpD